MVDHIRSVGGCHVSLGGVALHAAGAKGHPNTEQVTVRPWVKQNVTTLTEVGKMRK
jgi:hypothetical protein